MLAWIRTYYFPNKSLKPLSTTVDEGSCFSKPQRGLLGRYGWLYGEHSRMSKIATLLSLMKQISWLHKAKWNYFYWLGNEVSREGVQFIYLVAYIFCLPKCVVHVFLVQNCRWFIKPCHGSFILWKIYQKFILLYMWHCNFLWPKMFVIFVS